MDLVKLGSLHGEDQQLFVRRQGLCLLSVLPARTRVPIELPSIFPIIVAFNAASE